MSEESESVDDQAIGASLARFRTARGLSQSDLAERLGVAQQTIAKIEKGTRPLKYSEATRIARILRVSTSVFAARAESGVAEANALGLQQELRRAIDEMSAAATALAKAFARTAHEIAVDRARPDEYRAPEQQQMFFDSVLPLFQKLPDIFAGGLTAGVRAMAEGYGLRGIQKSSAIQILEKITQTPVKFTDDGVDGLTGWLGMSGHEDDSET